MHRKLVSLPILGTEAALIPWARHLVDQLQDTFLDQQLVSPDGSVWALKVDNAGVLTTVKISAP